MCSTDQNYSSPRCQRHVPCAREETSSKGRFCYTCRICNNCIGVPVHPVVGDWCPDWALFCFSMHETTEFSARKIECRILVFLFMFFRLSCHITDFLLLQVLLIYCLVFQFFSPELLYIIFFLFFFCLKFLIALNHFGY